MKKKKEIIGILKFYPIIENVVFVLSIIWLFAEAKGWTHTSIWIPIIIGTIALVRIMDYYSRVRKSIVSGWPGAKRFGER